MLDHLPRLANHLDQPWRQGALLHDIEILLQLLHAARTDDDAVASLGVEQRLPDHPPQPDGMSVDAVHASVLPDHLGGGEHGVVEVVVAVLGAEGRLGVPARPGHARGGARHLAGEEAAGRRAVGVEGDVVSAEGGEELLFAAAADGVVLALVDGGHDEAVGLAELDDLLYFRRGEVREAESLELPCLVGRVHGGERVFQWCGSICGVQVHDVHALDIERLETLVYAGFDVFGPMRAGHETLHLGADVGPSPDRHLLRPKQLFTCPATANGICPSRIDICIATCPERV